MVNEWALAIIGVLVMLVLHDVAKAINHVLVLRVDMEEIKRISQKNREALELLQRETSAISYKLDRISWDNE